MTVNLIKTDIAGRIILAICCFTPFLVMLLTAIRLETILIYIDYVLIPTLIFFIALTIYALIKKRKNSCEVENE